IEASTDYVFFTKDNNLIKKSVVSINVSNASIEEVLNLCFKDLPLSYKIIDKTIVIGKKEKPKVSAAESAAKPAAVPITGKVTDKKGVPLPGVSVKLRGTSIGTVTDADGNYSLSVPERKGTLVFTYIGFSTQEIVIGNDQTINAVLQEETSALSEVVVVGYGT